MVCRLAAKRQSRACPELSLAVRDRYAHQAHAITPDDRSQLDHYLLAPTGTYWHLLAPTGTYGDPLREQMARLEVPVFRVSTKHTHDAAELLDRVPSCFGHRPSLPR